jgi:hypothetical protein
VTDLTREPAEIVVETGPGARLLVRTWTTPNGHEVVAILPQYVGRSGGWVLKHSGLCLAPGVARELAPALLAMAETVKLNLRVRSSRCLNAPTA